jgi:hypothetical protein
MTNTTSMTRMTIEELLDVAAAEIGKIAGPGAGKVLPTISAIARVALRARDGQISVATAREEIRSQVAKLTLNDAISGASERASDATPSC